MKVLVCGGRDFNDGARLREVLDSFHKNLGPITCLVQGGPSGAVLRGVMYVPLNGIHLA